MWLFINVKYFTFRRGCPRKWSAVFYSSSDEEKYNKLLKNVKTRSLSNQFQQTNSGRKRKKRKKITVYLELLFELTLLDVSEFFLDPGLERWGEGGHVRTGDIELKVRNPWWSKISVFFSFFKTWKIQNA